ncbi:MAG: type II toxin-antitoxin system Phd/YefM family antitoxin [Deltaproteobacteria bacterium]
MVINKRQVPAGAFKQGCLALIDDVASSKQEIIITKRGKPVARLVPMEEPRDRERELLAQWRGKARQLVPDDELLAPTSESVPWKALDE